MFIKHIKDKVTMKIYTTLLNYNDTYLFYFTFYFTRYFYFYLRVTLIPENSIKQIIIFIFGMIIFFCYLKYIMKLIIL